jgi:hypothetical protein
MRHATASTTGTISASNVESCFLFGLRARIEYRERQGSKFHSAKPNHSAWHGARNGAYPTT